MFPQHYKIFYFLYNIAFSAIGGVMVGFGGGAIASFLNLPTVVPTTFLAAPSIFVAVGVVKILLGTYGSLLVALRKKPLYAIYVLLAILLMLATFAAAIISFLERPRAFNSIRTNLLSTYDTNSTAIPNIQNSFNCCGPRRVFNNTGGCTSSRPMNTFFGQGCLQPVSDEVLETLYDMGAIAMAFGSFELTSFLVAIQHTEGFGI